jgi:hypothetical protein
MGDIISRFWDVSTPGSGRLSRFPKVGEPDGAVPTRPDRRELDLNADARDALQALREAGRFPSVEKLSKASGVSESGINRMLAYPKETGANLETLSKVIDALETDPVSFFLSSPRYSARNVDPLAGELRRILTEAQLKEVVDLTRRLKRLGAVDAVLAAVRAGLRAIDKGSR